MQCLFFAMLALVLTAAVGCVERRLTVRTDPPGARVFIDDYEIGTSPCSTHFTYYGTRKIRLVKDGFRTKTVYQPIPPPWYQIPPLDFFAENVLPGKIRDHRTLSFQLEPEVIVPAEELRRRAEAMREFVSREAGVNVVPVDRVAPPREGGRLPDISLPGPGGAPGALDQGQYQTPGGLTPSVPGLYPALPPPGPMLPAQAAPRFEGQ
ncbi:MAG: PEGA domain-containing protein [Thermoguttaceae bacterium]|nr:PEGA domain-containing protein [Thermoguttaceae bacterium]